MSQPDALPTEDAAPGLASTGTWRMFLINTAVVCFLFTLIGWAYRPSLHHGPRQDQWCYLVDTIDQDDFPSLFAHSYSWCRTRVVRPGDYQLYRPVFFALLAAEKAFFGTDFVQVQRIGIWLHCLSVFLLLRILLLVHRLIPPSAADWDRRWLLWLAYALTLFFALNYAIIEMVIWSHIHGYLLFIVLALAATLMSLKHLTEPVLSPTRQSLLVGGAFLLVLVAAFTYEIGQGFAVVVGAVVAGGALRNGRRARALALFALFAAVLPLYQGVNLLDQAAHPQTPDVSLARIVERAGSAQTLLHALRYALYTAVQPFLPAQSSWYYFGRVAIKEPILSWEQQTRAGPWLIPSLVVFAAGFLLLGLGLCNFAAKQGRAVRLLVIALPLCFFALHGAATVFGRMNLRSSPDVLTINSYYAYLPLLGVLISVYTIATWAASGRTTSPSRLFLPVSVSLLLGLVALSWYSGVKVHSINVAVANDPNIAGLRQETRIVRNLIARHKGDPNFSIAFDDTVCANMQRCHGIPLQLIMFKRFVNNHHPQYVFSMPNGKLAARLVQAHSPRTPHMVGDLVAVGTVYNFYKFDGWCHGIRAEEGYYVPTRKDYTSLIVDSTLDGAKRQVSQLLQQAASAR